MWAILTGTRSPKGTSRANLGNRSASWANKPQANPALDDSCQVQVVQGTQGNQARIIACRYFGRLLAA